MNFCIRIIHNKKKYDHISYFRTLHQWADFDNIARVDFSKFTTKIKRKESSDYLNNILENTNHGKTRHSFFKIKSISNFSGAKSIEYRVPNHLNSSVY
ncbi:MAG: hypothetical protein ACRC0V_01970 [Fusobacteriaceae bacterium]